MYNQRNQRVNKHIQNQPFQRRQLHTRTYYISEAKAMYIIVVVWFLSHHPGTPLTFVKLLFYAEITGPFPEYIDIFTVTILFSCSNDTF